MTTVETEGMDVAGAARAYRQFIETLSLETLPRLNELAVPDVHYRDPLNEARDVESVKRVMARVFKDVDDPRYIITHAAVDGDTCFLRWKFTCRPRLSGRGQPWIVDGVTEVRFNGEGRVVELIDHWDAGHYVYERLPLLGYLVRYLRKRLAIVLN